MSAEEKQVLEMLEAIERGELTVKMVGDETWIELYAGDAEFLLSNGWRVIVFNDCGSWDYIDSYITPEGRKVDLFDDENPGSEQLRGWCPTKGQYFRWGISTGYLNDPLNEPESTL